MRRLALLLVGGAVWLFLAAIPVFADGGPHVMSINNGSGGLNADSCAGCHRLHSSQSPTGYLLTSSAPTVTEFCLTCHGAVGAGATTDVETGLQYYIVGGGSIATDKTTGSTLGALRGGGFLEARIGSGDAYRDLTWGWNFNNTAQEARTNTPKVPVAATATAVTSAHIALPGNANGLVAQGIAWGNSTAGQYSLTPNPGTTINGDELECTSCHNPHGNGQYRILNPIPGDGSGGMIEVTAGVTVSDDTTSTGIGDQTRNYTVIQTAPNTTDGAGGTTPTYYLLRASQVDSLAAANTATGNYGPLSGDYLHKYGDYLAPTTKYDAPNGNPSTFYSQMSKWCTACHTRYVANHQTSTANPDAIFTYQHTSNANSRFCTTCHVSHGSNAVMNTNTSAGTTFSADLTNPGGSTNPNVGDSRLLKIDNRGTCFVCHDPTNGSAIPTYPNLTVGDHIQQGTVPTLFP